MPSNTRNASLYVSFTSLLDKMKPNRLLKSCGFSKRTGASCLYMLITILEAIFMYPNLFRLLDSERGKYLGFGKSSAYRFLNNPQFNWQKLLLKMSAFATGFMASLNGKEHINCFVADDTIIERPRSKRAELLSYQFNHVTQKTEKAFTNLSLGWTDGLSYIPVLSYLICSHKKNKIIREANKDLDQRLASSEQRKIALMPKPEVLKLMVKRALNAGIKASYLLVDSWFFSEKLISSMEELGIGVMSLVKSNIKFSLTGDKNTFKTQLQIVKYLMDSGKFAQDAEVVSCCVFTTQHRYVKLVLVRNYKNKGKWHAIVSTDVSLSAKEIVRHYKKRWSIEEGFRTLKQYLGLKTSGNKAHEFNTINACMIISTMRLLLLELNRRMSNDQRSLGQLFYITGDRMREEPYEEALISLVAIFDNMPAELEILGILPPSTIEQITKYLKGKFTQWLLGLSDYTAAIMSRCGITSSITTPS